jgi:hypothetical protein
MESLQTHLQKKTFSRLNIMLDSWFCAERMKNLIQEINISGVELL